MSIGISNIAKWTSSFMDIHPTPQTCNSPANFSLFLRAKHLLEGVHGDNIEEVLNSTIAIVDSVRSTPVPHYVIEAIHYMTDFVTQKNCPVRGKRREFLSAQPSE